MTQGLLPTYDDVLRARALLASVVHRTPVLTSLAADVATGGHLYFKCENFQRAGAFKFRGAFNAIANLSVAQRKAGVLTFSSGNHAQAIALAAQLLDVPATLIMPHDAPAVKRAAAEGYGGKIVTYNRHTERREAIAHAMQQATGMTLIPPYDHPDVMAGQGTAAAELFEQAGRLDMLITGLGGGGLLSGSALAAKAINPDCEIIGVEPEAGNDGQQSMARGEIVTIAPPVSIADGALTPYVGKLPFAIMQRDVTRIETVSDAQLVQTMRFFAERMKLVVEPTGCLAAAAVLHGVIPVKGKRVGVLISGGNVDVAAYGRLLAG